MYTKKKMKSEKKLATGRQTGQYITKKVEIYGCKCENTFKHNPLVGGFGRTGGGGRVMSKRSRQVIVRLGRAGIEAGVKINNPVEIPQ